MSERTFRAPPSYHEMRVSQQGGPNLTDGAECAVVLLAFSQRQRRSGALEPLLPDPERLDLRCQRRARDAELCGGSRRPGHPPPARSERPLDRLSFAGAEVLGQRSNGSLRLVRFATQPAIVDGE